MPVVENRHFSFYVLSRSATIGRPLRRTLVRLVILFAKKRHGHAFTAHCQLFIAC